MTLFRHCSRRYLVRCIVLAVLCVLLGAALVLWCEDFINDLCGKLLHLLAAGWVP